jgi:hypothetical protein
MTRKKQLQNVGKTKKNSQTKPEAKSPQHAYFFEGGKATRRRKQMMKRKHGSKKCSLQAELVAHSCCIVECHRKR